MTPNIHVHRPASYIVLYDGSKVFLVLRENTQWRDGEYALPAGKVKPGEGFAAAAIREAKEEIGITIRPEHLKPVHFSNRLDEFDKTAWDDMYFMALMWKGKPHNAEPMKHAHAKWFDVKDLPVNTIGFQKEIISHIVSGGKVYSEFGW